MNSISEGDIRAKRFAFRVDANSIIANGHMVRSTSIADAARRNGIETLIIVSDDDSYRVAAKTGHRVVSLHAKWDELDFEIEIMKSLLEDEHMEVLLVDSYYVTENYLNEMSKVVRTAAFAYEKQLDCRLDYLIDYANIFGNHNTRLMGDEKSQVLSGFEYTPLRMQFRDKTLSINERIKTVLVMSGGSDPYDCLFRTTDILLKKTDYDVIVVCGSQYKKGKEMIELYENSVRVKVVFDVDDISKYMLMSDVAISSAGTTLYELCACGVPTVSYIMADNQKHNAKMFEEERLIRCAGDVRGEFDWACFLRLMEEFGDPNTRQELSRRMRGKVDGKGANRIIERIFNP